MLSAPSSRAAAAAAAEVVLPGHDVPLFPGCLVDVFDGGSWHRATVMAVDVCGSSGTLRLRRRSGQTVIVNASDVPLRLRHCRHTMATVRRMRRMLARVAAARSARPPSHDSRVARARAAGLKRNPLASRRFFAELRESRRSGVDPNQLLCLDLCSGPFKSVSLSVNRHLDSSLAVTVDLEESFAPDVAADLRTWDLWGFLLQNCRSEKGRIHCFVHIHASPPCTTYVLLNNEVNTRSASSPVAGPHSRPAARDADEVSRTIAFLVRQCARCGLPTTWSIENPHGSMLWKLPCMKQLFATGLLEPVRVDYCRYGNAGAKPTIFAVSPTLSGERASWAWRCSRRDGNCGAFRRASPQSSPYHGGPLSHQLIDSYIPATLCGLLSCAWVRIHSPQRCNDANYCTVTVDTARQLQAEWAAFTTSNAVSLASRTAISMSASASGNLASSTAAGPRAMAPPPAGDHRPPPPAVSDSDTRPHPNAISYCSSRAARVAAEASQIATVTAALTEELAVLLRTTAALAAPGVAAASAAPPATTVRSGSAPSQPNSTTPAGTAGLPAVLRLSQPAVAITPLGVCPVLAQRAPPAPTPRVAGGRKRPAELTSPPLPAPQRRRSNRRPRVCVVCGTGGILLGTSEPICRSCASLHAATAPQQLHRRTRPSPARQPSPPSLPTSSQRGSSPCAKSVCLTTTAAEAATIPSSPNLIASGRSGTAAALGLPLCRNLFALIEAFELETGEIIRSCGSASALLPQ